MDVEVKIFLASLAVAAYGGILQFIISTLVRLGKLETRVNTNEKDLDGLGELYRNNKTQRERKSA